MKRIIITEINFTKHKDTNRWLRVLFLPIALLVPMSLWANAYLSFNVDYPILASSSNTSDIKFKQVPNDPAPTIFKYNNKKSKSNFGMGIDSGYQWAMSQHWSWSLGTRLRRQVLDQPGEFSILGVALSDYDYDITATNISLTSRLLYTQVSWTYYAELDVGMVNLQSDNYREANSSGYNNNTLWQRSYGVGLGIMHRLSAHSSIGFSVDYADLGTAKLGAPTSITFPSVSTGYIQQRLQLVNIGLQVIHWF